jgi:hypothetical protein
MLRWGFRKRREAPPPVDPSTREAGTPGYPRAAGADRKDPSAGDEWAYLRSRIKDAPLDRPPVDRCEDHQTVAESTPAGAAALAGSPTGAHSAEKVPCVPAHASQSSNIQPIPRPPTSRPTLTAEDVALGEMLDLALGTPRAAHATTVPAADALPAVPAAGQPAGDVLNAALECGEAAGLITALSALSNSIPKPGSRPLVAGGMNLQDPVDL